MISAHNPYNFPHGNGYPQCVFQRQNNCKTLARLSKRVSRCWWKTAMPKGGSWLQRSIHSCRDDRWVIVDREKFPQFAHWFYDKFSVDLLDVQLKHTARLSQLVSKKVLEEEVFVNWRLIMKITNFCLTKENFLVYGILPILWGIIVHNPML